MSDRPLKYETTRPISRKKQSGKPRKGSGSGAHANGPALQLNPRGDGGGGGGFPANTFITNNNAAPDPARHESSFAEHIPPLPEERVEDILAEAPPAQPPISVRVRNAVTRPEHVDKFTDDLHEMEVMEREFKKNASTLQKRLGLPQDGMV